MATTRWRRGSEINDDGRNLLLRDSKEWVYKGRYVPIEWVSKEAGIQDDLVRIRRRIASKLDVLPSLVVVNWKSQLTQESKHLFYASFASFAKQFIDNEIAGR